MLILFIAIAFSQILLSDEELSKLLVSDYFKRISHTKQGRELVRYIKEDEIKIYLEYWDDGWLSWYEEGGRIFFNLKYLMIFFSIEDYDKERIEKVMRYSKEVREEFVRYTDFLFVHELVHHLQSKRYPELKKYKDEFVELEYEAFVITDVYFYQKMRRDKRLFADILQGKYYDLYTDYAMGGFISSFNDFERYLDEIKRRYLDEVKGYVSLSEKEKEKKMKLEEKKILSYAGGKRRAYEKSKEEYLKLKKIYERYLSDINRKVKRMWLSYLDDALIYTIKTASAVGNYAVSWRGCYFLHKIYKKNCLDFSKFLEVRFKDALKRAYGSNIDVVVKELYWYERFVKEVGKTSVVKDLYSDIVKDAIVYCDKKNDRECLNMIDEISELDLVK